MSYNHLAFINCLQGNYEEAIQNLSTAETILRENHEDEFDKRSIVTYGNYAWVYYHKGQLTEAQSYLDKLERICQQFPDASRYTAMIPEVYGEKGWSLLKYDIQHYKEAMECFETALEEDPSNIDWNFGYATVLSRRDKHSGATESVDSSQSVKQWRRVLVLDPNHAEAMVQLALKLRAFEQYEEADTLVKQALEKSPGLPYVLRYAAIFYRSAGDIEKALKLLNKALKMTPKSAFLHHQKGLCYKKQVKLLKQLLKKNPGSRNPRNPDFEKKTRLVKNCKECFKKAIELKQSFIIAKLDYAKIYTLNEEYDEAEKIYSSLLELENICPENKQEIRLHAALFQLYHKHSEANAINYFLEGLKIKCDSTARKRCHSHLETIVERQLCNNQWNHKAFCIRGLMYLLDGKESEAIECFENILKLHHGNEE
ncbi:hypothetical protein scyTo_0015403 [Scyliorhinus torazame]|uniref:Uncharacterized protein n=2 Tax=Scyliorhinus torazame TaxID=75743 RepID=A0A401PSB2_SCYTO|nr:hypothetical protein [Scyliorhinus torazame]